MGLEGKRVAILVENQYQMHEFWYPFYRFQEAGAEVKVIGTGRKDTFTSHDYDVRADLPAGDAKVDDFDAVVIPGGYAPDMMRRSPAMVAFVRDMDSAGKPVAAICHDLEAAGAQWSDEPVVVDGNLITSRVPGDLPAFCKAVIKALSPVPAAVG